MKAKKEVTIYDLANALKCSASTVSRALNNHQSISQKTRHAVQEMARNMGYRPNILAAGLRNNKSKTIGVLVSRINRPFSAALISGIEETARKAGYTVLISQSSDHYENEVSNSRALYDSRVAGLIVSLAMETRDLDHFRNFADQGIPIVFVDRVPEEFNTCKVVIDNYTAGYQATKHLIDQGCKRIAHFAGSQHRNIYEGRTRGYRDALKAHGLPVEEGLIIPFKTLSFKEGRKATKKLMKQGNPPDGIFSANDTAAVSAIMYAKKLGIAIPEQLAIIGFNDDPIASIVEPSLSTVSHPGGKMGEISALKILEQSESDANSTPPETTVLDTEIIVRQSSLRKLLLVD